MNNLIKAKLINLAKEKMFRNDTSHDISHAKRVLSLSEKICKLENGDLDIVIPSSIFHDVINYPKNHHKRLSSSMESAIFAKKILQKMDGFPKEKIKKVFDAINSCSFTKGLIPSFLEGKILQDADALESLGAISIMRTFSSYGLMNKPFYQEKDPFCRKRKPNDGKYALDLFFTRLLVIQNRLHTKSAKQIAKRRIFFLNNFLKELKIELSNK